MNDVPGPLDHDPAFMPMYVELDGLRRIPRTEGIATALDCLRRAESAYHADDVAAALGLVWDAGTALYRDAYIAAAKIQRSKTKKKTGRKGARSEVFECWNDLMM